MAQAITEAFQSGPASNPRPTSRIANSCSNTSVIVSAAISYNLNMFNFAGIYHPRINWYILAI